MSTVYDVAVVGSRGFLGSAVAAELERRGAHVGRFTKEHPYTTGAATVVWAAGHVTPADTTRGKHNIGDLTRLIDAARRSAHLPHVVLLSSGGAVYGPPSVAPFRETDEPSPANEYGRIKLAEETLLAAEGVPHTVLRISNPYGPDQVSKAVRAVGGQGVVGHWLAAIRTGTPVTIFGDGTAIRDYVYVDYVAHAIATAGCTSLQKLQASDIERLTRSRGLARHINDVFDKLRGCLADLAAAQEIEGYVGVGLQHHSADPVL